MKLDALYIVVRDIRSASGFYSKLFERKPVITDDRFTWFDLDGGLFGLFNAARFGEEVDSRDLVYGNNCVANIRVPDLESLHARVPSIGPAELTKVQVAGPYRFFQIQDADGNRVEFYETEQ